MTELYEVVIEHNSQQKYLYTLAESAEEAGQKINRYIICQWVGYPWTDPEALLDGTIDKIKNDDIIV